MIIEMRFSIILPVILLFCFGCSDEGNGHIQDGYDTDPIDLPMEIGEDTTPSDGPCGAGLSLCFGSCVDLQSDHENCGSCGNACEIVEVCSEGECTFECPPGKENCGGSCIDLSDNLLNCGECGNACTAGEHASPICVSGECDVSCQSSWCNRDGDNTCEEYCAPPPEEVCNGLDDDGDGSIDEGFECPQGDEQDCGVCGYQTCGSTCEWDPCGNEDLEKWQRCNDCGVQYCNGDGTGWGACVGPFDDCAEGYGCDSSGWCVSTCIDDWQPCDSHADCCSGICCDCHPHGCSDCWPDGNYDEFCDDAGGMTCRIVCINICNIC